MMTAIELIDKLIAEHKIINESSEYLERAASDASLLNSLQDAKETFTPGRLDQSKSLDKLHELLTSMSPWLNKHFENEETVLLSVVEELGDRELITALNSLLLEHTDLRNRMTQVGAHIAELKSGSLTRHRWDASANDMRAHLTHTRKLLAAHAAMENDLFGELRRHLTERS